MTAFRLPRLPRNVPLITQGQPTQVFQQWWQSVVSKLEAQEGTQDDLIAAIAAAQAAAATAQAAAATAQTAATSAATDAATAQASADGANTVAALTNSGVVGAVITATDAGANVTITISAHNRLYGDGTSVAVAGGSLTGRAYTTLYYVYYDDPARAGGAVSYQTTTSETTAAQTGDRHLVGSVTTPAAAGAPSGGNYVLPPGLGSIP
jgi:ribosomal protein L12E/L44/L45/RPP1/RPP2